MDRVRKISEEILAKYPNTFGTDYQANKEQLNKIAIVHSKMLRNKIAGYITKMLGNAETATEEEKREEGSETTGTSSEATAEEQGEAPKAQTGEETPATPAETQTSPPVQEQQVTEKARSV